MAQDRRPPLTGRGGLELELPDEEPAGPDDRLCDYGRAFQCWCDEHITPLEASPSVIAVAYKKLLLQDKYQDYRNAVPRQHQSYTGRNHECLFHVYCRAYNRIRVVELGLPASIPFSPTVEQAPRTLPPQQVAGIVIGEQG